MEGEIAVASNEELLGFRPKENRFPWQQRGVPEPKPSPSGSADSNRAAFGRGSPGNRRQLGISHFSSLSLLENCGVRYDVRYDRAS